MWLKRHKKNQQRVKVKQYLITVNVLGSSGPIRFFVNENELVADVIDSALKNYAREDRLPVLGSSNVNDFLLYCSKPVHDALCPSEKIRACGVRDFVLCKTQNPLDADLEGRSMKMTNGKASRSCKAWFGKSISFKF